MDREQFMLLVFSICIVSGIVASAYVRHRAIKRIGELNGEWIRIIGLYAIELGTPLFMMLIWFAAALGLPVAFPDLAEGAVWSVFIVGSFALPMVFFVVRVRWFLAALLTPPDELKGATISDWRQYAVFAIGAMACVLALAAVTESDAPFVYVVPDDGKPTYAPICSGDTTASFRVTAQINEPVTVSEIDAAVKTAAGKQLFNVDLVGGNNRHLGEDITGFFDLMVGVHLEPLPAGEYIYSHTATDINQADRSSIATNVLTIPFEVVDCE